MRRRFANTSTTPRPNGIWSASALEASKYLLDTHNATGYYFYYERDRLTTLGVDTLHIVTERAEQYVIYADVCTLSKEDMAAKNIVFKKIPRDIKRF